MADYHVVDAERFEHPRRNLAGVRAVILEVQVLCAEFNRAPLQRLRRGVKPDRRRANDYLRRVADILHLLTKCRNKFRCLPDILVHFPVSCNNLLSHNASV